MFSFYSAGDGSVAIIPFVTSVRVCLGKRETTVPRDMAEDAIRNFATFTPEQGRTTREAAVEIAQAIMHRDGMKYLGGRVCLDVDGYVVPGCGMAKTDAVVAGWA